ncbi:hypothetical protein QW180_21840 [Vibrio sinaloensis]|nr:hypothetical protein [Vibrio sinaloensis]
MREGNMPPGMMPELPFISGVEGSGIVSDANGTELKQGQKKWRFFRPNRCGYLCGIYCC